jgi:uncharacterized protein YceK
MLLHAFGPEGSPVYRGAKHDCRLIAEDDLGTLPKIAIGADLPFSFIADTLFLPFDIFEYRAGPLRKQELFPRRTNLIVTGVGDVKDSQFCPNKSTIDDYQGYIRSNKLNSVTDVLYCQEGTIRYEGNRQILENRTGWHAIVFTVQGSEYRKYTDYVLEYNKFDIRTKVRKKRWMNYSW